MKIINRRARFNYELQDDFEAGIVLSGAEVKAVRAKRVNLTNAYAKVIGTEVYLVNAAINTELPEGNYTKTRKLLLHRKEIGAIITKIKAKKLTLVPVAMYTKGRLVKLKLALAKSKKKHQKREILKKKVLEREIRRELKK